MRTFRVSLVAILAGALLAPAFTGCAAGDRAEGEAECKDPKPGVITTVNSMCVVENEDPVNPAVEPVVWKGQRVGFCCKGCKPRWEALGEAERDAAVAKAIAVSKR